METHEMRSTLLKFLGRVKASGSKARLGRAAKANGESGRAIQGEPLGNPGASDIDILREHQKTCSWPRLYYSKIQSLIAISNPETVLEVGVAYGYHARHILEKNPSVRYTGVDPYLPNYDDQDPFSADVEELFGVSGAQAMDHLYEAVRAGLLEDFGDRFRLLRSTSTEAAALLSNERFDFIFIDGDHRYEEVLADLRAWWPRLKPGGLLVGDDFSWPGVSKAVAKFAKEAQAEMYVLSMPGEDHQTFYLWG